MTRAKLAFVGFVAAGNSMWHQVLDDAKVSASLSQISPQRHATLPTHQTVPSTTPYYKVLKSATPVLFCTTKYYSSTTSCYKILLQYYKVLQSISPVLLRTTKHYSSTTKYYSSTTRYYKVLLQKVLLQYYKVLVQYYFVLQSISPVLQSTTPVLLRTTKYYSSTTKC